jgi:spore coat polysaccharide biosynthesis protein SpsF
MNTFSGFITVRTGSTRLPNKCLLPFGSMNVLEHIILRAKYYNIDPIICTTTEKEDIQIVKIAEQNNVKYFRGSLHNKLKRWLDCCEYFNIDKFHTVDADDPFFDGDLMRKSFELLSDKYDMIYPTPSSSNGTASVGFSLTKDIIKKACLSMDENSDTEMMWHYVEKIPNIRTFILPEQEDNPVMARLTLDYEEDYLLLRTIERLVSHVATRKEVDDLLRTNPDLYKVNWFRNDEWKQKQKEKQT